MRIEIIPENEKEAKDLEKKVYENVYEFAMTGSLFKEKVKYEPFNHLYVDDMFVLLGKLEELKERLKSNANPK